MTLPKTLAKIAVINSQGQILLVRRSETAPRRAFDWELPGGIIESGEDPKVAAMRELHEEAGIVVPDAEYLFAGTVDDLSFAGFFFYAIVNDPQVNLSYEHDDYEWLYINEAIDKVTVPGYKHALTYYRDYILNGYIVKVATKCIINKKDQTLLLKRSPTDSLGPGMWDLPGGGMEPNETVYQSMARELKEETGLMANNLQLVFGHTHLEDSKTIKIRLGLLASEVTGNIKLSLEHSNYQWVPLGQAYGFSKHDHWPGWSKFIKLFG